MSSAGTSVLDREGRPTYLHRRNQNDLFDRLDPEGRGHLRGLSVGGCCCGLPQQEGGVVSSASEKRRRRRRGRGNYQGDRFDDLLFADVIAQQRIWIVEKGLRDGAGRDETA